MTKVLIVDDEESIRYSFSSILTDAGYEVIKAGHIIEAKAILSANQFDVAIVDRLLVSSNGMEIIKYINKIQPFCTAILISAFPNFKSASEGFKYRLFAYLQKPVKKDELLLIVKEAAQNSKEKLKLYNYELLQIQNQKMVTMGMLASGIVHDFNNMLMIISGITQLSCYDLSDNDPHFKNFEQIQKVSNQSAKLTRLLLSYIKQSNGELENIQIQSLVKKALTILRIAVSKEITIQENIYDGNDETLVYTSQIQQVIINLGLNAAHAIGEKIGIIDVNLEKVQLDIKLMESLDIQEQNCIKISMKDSGCGMDEKIFDKIFDPFFTTKPTKEGTGIGLSISSTILKLHGGAITAESELEKGSTFHIYLPLINNEI